MLLARNYGSDLLIKNLKTNLRKYILITVTWYIFITAAFHSNRLRFNTMVNVFWVLAIIIYIVNIKIHSFFIFHFSKRLIARSYVTNHAIEKCFRNQSSPSRNLKFFDDKSAIRMNTSYTVPKFSILGSSKHKHKNRFHCI